MERYIKKHGKIRQWSPTFKAFVIKTTIDQKLSYGEAAEQFNLSGQHVVARWMMEHRRQLAAEQTIGAMPEHTSPCAQPDSTAAEQIKQLQQALKEADMKNVALNALIELAEETYRIPIRKNSGTKQHDS